MRNDLLTLVANIQARLKTSERKPAWFAAKSGVDKGTVSRLLKDQAGNPTLDVISKFALALECETWELLRPEALDANSSAGSGRVIVVDAVSLLQNYRDAKPDDQRMVRQILGLDTEADRAAIQDAAAAALPPTSTAKPKLKT